MLINLHGEALEIDGLKKEMAYRQRRQAGIRNNSGKPALGALANDILGSLKTHRMDFGQGIGQVNGVLCRRSSFDYVHLLICIQTVDCRHFDAPRLKRCILKKSLADTPKSAGR
jgi:hypothetical protein